MKIFVCVKTKVYIFGNFCKNVGAFWNWLHCSSSIIMTTTHYSYPHHFNWWTFQNILCYISILFIICSLSIHYFNFPSLITIESFHVFYSLSGMLEFTSVCLNLMTCYLIFFQWWHVGIQICMFHSSHWFPTSELE